MFKKAILQSFVLFDPYHMPLPRKINRICALMYVADCLISTR
jgi:hypothetical protein